MREAASVRFVGASAKEPVQLSGPPRRLAGRLLMRNQHTETIVLRNALLSDRSGQLLGMPARYGFAPIVLRPAEERLAPLVIALDPATAPGEYHVELDVMGHVRPAVLNVSESIALRVEPKRIFVPNNPDAPQRTQLVVTNDGNVPVTLGDIGYVDLRDDVAQVRDLRGVIGPLLDKVPDDLDDLVAVLLAIVPPRGPVEGRLSVRLHGTPTIEPSKTARVELEITVPAEFPVYGRYRGRAALVTADLEFMVVPQALLNRGKPTPKAKSASASRTKRRPGATSGKRKKEGGRK